LKSARTPGSGAVWLSTRTAFFWRARDLGEQRDSGVPIAPAFGVMGWEMRRAFCDAKLARLARFLFKLHHYPAAAPELRYRASARPKKVFIETN